MLSSPVFRTMLHPSRFKEGHAPGQGRRAEVAFPDDDPAAFRLLLQIIHNRTRELPRTISLELLTKFSILVDKYRLMESSEAVDIFVRWWVEDLKPTLPTSFTSNLLPWLTISWIFQLPEEFRQLTHILQLECTEDFAQQVAFAQLPIPEEVIGKQSPCLRRSHSTYPDDLSFSLH
jgi:hypothetical protein